MSDALDDKLAEILRDSAAAASIPGQINLCKSPIERLMFGAIWSRLVWTGRSAGLPWERDFKNLLDNASREVEPVWSLQVELDPYTVDFLFIQHVAWDEPPSIIAVECDGHEFHSRTKEQAAKDRQRDRHLLEHGVQTMRFTGSEIWRDAGACAEQVYSVVSAPWHRYQARFTDKVKREMAEWEKARGLQ